MKLHMPASRRNTSAEASAAAMASMDRQHAAEPPISSGRRPSRSMSSNAAPTPTNYAAHGACFGHREPRCYVHLQALVLRC